jgi:uncharacterized protein YbjT (DUF2867 family)
MDIAILGAGNWGTTLAVMLAGQGHSVRMWEYRPDLAREIELKRENAVFLPGVALPDKVRVTGDLAEALALTVERPPPNSIYEIDDGHEEAYSYADMATAAGEALGRRPWRIGIPRRLMAAVAGWNTVRQSLGGSTQILTRGKVAEIFHPDWAVHDRRLAEAVGFRSAYDLGTGFRDTILWYRGQGWL